MSNRPKYLNLFQIRQPVPAIISIMHRISGAALFLALPLLLCWWQQSVTSMDTYSSMSAMFSNPVVKVIALALLWGYLHHLCAGVRHLLLDLNIGTELSSARVSAML